MPTFPSWVLSVCRCGVTDRCVISLIISSSYIHHPLHMDVFVLHIFEHYTHSAKMPTPHESWVTTLFVVFVEHLWKKRFVQQHDNCMSWESGATWPVIFSPAGEISNWVKCLHHILKSIVCPPSNAFKWEKWLPKWNPKLNLKLMRCSSGAYSFFNSWV